MNDIDVFLIRILKKCILHFQVECLLADFRRMGKSYIQLGCQQWLNKFCLHSL